MPVPVCCGAGAVALLGTGLSAVAELAAASASAPAAADVSGTALPLCCLLLWEHKCCETVLPIHQLTSSECRTIILRSHKMVLSHAVHFQRVHTLNCTGNSK